MDISKLTYEQQERIRKKVFMKILLMGPYNPHKDRHHRMYNRLIMTNGANDGFKQTERTVS